MVALSLVFRRRLTPVGVLAMSGFAVTLLAGYVAGELFPGSSLGAFLGTWFGLLMSFAGAWLAYVAASGVLALAGYPCFVRDTGSHV